MIFELIGDNIIKVTNMDGAINLKVRYRSSPNIAWVKYWGKYDEDFILPINDSLGLTLNPDDICTKTDIVFSDQLPQNVLYLNGEMHSLSKRVQKMFKKIKEMVYDRKFKDKVDIEKWNNSHFEVRSVNSFPTASGMASSASGLACLAAALNGLFDNVLSLQQLSQLARLGSGSASRSICGGLVRWIGVDQQIFNGKVQKSNELLEKLSKKCISLTVVPANQLNNIKVLILLANDKKKQVSSTSGMQQSVQTSKLIKLRNSIANQRIQSILNCLTQINNAQNQQEQKKHFNTMAEIIIRDSNQFHAICLDTYPPIFYLNQFSKQIITIVDCLINKSVPYKVAYTFDAGPHAFLFMHQSVLHSVLHYFGRLFKIQESGLNKKAKKVMKECQGRDLGQIQQYKGEVISPYEIWVSDVGCGSHQIGMQQ